MANRVSDRDRGYRKRLKSIAKAGRLMTVTVGVHDAEGGAAATGGDLTVADVATFGEFGTPTAPSRSFIRGYVDENETQIEADLRKMGEGIADGKITQQVGLERFGLFTVGAIQSRISDGIPPPNAESTIAAKGSSTPLINFGQLRSSILHKVEGA